MRLHRTAPTRAFSTFSNALLRDHRISWCAAGILLYLLSLPSQATTDIRRLAKQRREGRDRIAAALYELEDARYLKRVSGKDPKTGQFFTEYEVYDAPYAEEQPAQAGNPAPGEPGDGETGALPTEETTRAQEPPARRRRAAPAAPVVVPESLRSAVSLLTSLGRKEPRLALGTAEAVELAPLVQEWRAAGATDDTLRTALTSGLPDIIHSAPALLKDRLRRKLPQRPGPAPPRLAECRDCRAPIPGPGRCRSCTARTPAPEAVPEAHRETTRRGAAAARAAWRRTRVPSPA